jgi:hypothetical protein
MDTTFLYNIKDQVISENQPWKHWQIDNFLPTQVFARFQETLCSTKNKFFKREDDEADINYMFLPDLQLAKFFLDDDFKSFLEEITGAVLSVHQGGLVQLRKMDPSSPAFPIHIDSQDERSLVCLYYVSPGWQKGCGGELCLYQKEETSVEVAPDQLIAPIANRMVLFFSDDTHWHSVRKVHDWNRYCVVSEWIVG